MEEPLEIALVSAGPGEAPRRRVFTVTMRTPGADTELALGLLRSEGVIRGASDVVDVRRETGTGDNEIEVVLAAGITPDWSRYERNLATQSSCGVCGKTSLQSLALRHPPAADGSGGWLEPTRVPRMVEAMRQRQRLFLDTGGTHAAGLFDERGELLALREDVGRHNAFDKVVGDMLRGPAASAGPRRVVVLSGRASFELAQKAVMAGIPVVVAVGAPSSLALRVAQQHDLTLVGFASDAGFSVYHGAFRLRAAPGTKEMTTVE